MGIFNLFKTQPKQPLELDLTLGTILIAMTNVPQITLGDIDKLLNDNAFFGWKDRDYVLTKVLSEYNKIKNEGKWLDMLSSVEKFRGKMSTIQIYKLMQPYENVNQEGVSTVYDLFLKHLGYSRDQIKEFWFDEEGKYLEK